MRNLRDIKEDLHDAALSWAMGNHEAIKAVFRLGQELLAHHKATAGIRLTDTNDLEASRRPPREPSVA